MAIAIESTTETILAEAKAIHHQFQAAALLAIALLSIGATFYHFVEHFNWIDAFYFCTITLTTIGYGDLAPVTNAGKIFTIFYVLLGIGVIAYFANIVIKNAVLRRELRRSKKKTA